MKKCLSKSHYGRFSLHRQLSSSTNNLLNRCRFCNIDHQMCRNSNLYRIYSNIFHNRCQNHRISQAFQNDLRLEQRNFQFLPHLIYRSRMWYQSRLLRHWYIELPNNSLLFLDIYNNPRYCWLDFQVLKPYRSLNFPKLPLKTKLFYQKLRAWSCW